MKIYRWDITKDIESVGYKRALDTGFFVHPKKNLCCEIISPVPNIWVFRRIEPFIGTSYLYATDHKGVRHQLHRLKALAFLSLEEYRKRLPTPFNLDELRRSKLVVNHKDGNKLNNDVDNLEWTTYSGNNIHAFKTNLRPDNSFVVCWDVVEEKETVAYSMSELGRMLGIHPDYVSRYLKTKRNSLLAHRYMVRLEGEDYPYKLTIDDVWNSRILGITPVSVEDLETGEVTYYPTLRMAGIAIGVSSVGKKGYSPNLDKIFLKRYKVKAVTDAQTVLMIKEEFDKNHKGWHKKDRKPRPPLPIRVTDSNGNVEIYSSTVKAAEALGLTASALKARLLRYNGKWNGYNLEYIRASGQGESLGAETS